MSFSPKRWTPGDSRYRGFGPTHVKPKILSWACALFQSAPKHRAAASCRQSRSAETTPPLRFLPLKRFPAWSSGILPELSTARAPAPTGFLNLLTRSSAPYLPALFRAGSARGVSPSELSSSCAAVRRFRRPSPLDVGTAQPVLTTEPRAHHRSELRYQTRATRTDCENLPYSPVFRGLLHTGVRHSRPTG
jgi:hypothetical protein